MVRFEEVACPSDKMLVWSVLPIMHSGDDLLPPRAIWDQIGFHHPPKVERVVDHLVNFTTKLAHTAAGHSAFAGGLSVQRQCEHLYGFLQQLVKREQNEGSGSVHLYEASWSKLRGPAWILVDPNIPAFAGVGSVFLNLGAPGAGFPPLLYKVPSALLEYSPLLRRVGVADAPHTSTLLQALATMQARTWKDGVQREMDPNGLKLLVAFAAEVQKGREGVDGNVTARGVELANIWVPDESATLVPASKVVVCDEPQLRSSIRCAPFRFQHPNVPASVVSTLELQCLSGLVSKGINSEGTAQLEIPQDDVALRFTESLRSAEFQTGLLRVLEHQVSGTRVTALGNVEEAEPRIGPELRLRVQGLRNFSVIWVQRVIPSFRLVSTNEDITKEGSQSSCLVDGEHIKVYLAVEIVGGTKLEDLLAQAINLHLGSGSLRDRLPLSAMFGIRPELIPSCLSGLGVTEKVVSPIGIARLGCQLSDAQVEMLKDGVDHSFIEGEWIAWEDGTDGPDSDVYRFGRINGACDPNILKGFSASYRVQVEEGCERILYGAAIYKFVGFWRSQKPRAGENEGVLALYMGEAGVGEGYEEPKPKDKEINEDKRNDPPPGETFARSYDGY
jgi:hypothetical protein